jgi:hypothetical protein
MTDNDDIKKCQGWTSRRDFRNNLPCGNRAQPGKAYCRVHDPDLSEQRWEKRKQRIEEKRNASLELD